MVNGLLWKITKKDYKKIAIEEQAEVLLLAGDVSIHAGSPEVHAHVVLGAADGTAKGGHLLKGHVRPTLEIILTKSPRTSLQGI